MAFRRRKKEGAIGQIIDLEAQKKEQQSGKDSNISGAPTVQAIIFSAIAIILLILACHLDAVGLISVQPVKSVRRSIHTAADKVHLKLLAQVMFAPDDNIIAAAKESNKVEQPGGADTATANAVDIALAEERARLGEPKPESTSTKDFCGCPGTCTSQELYYQSGFGGHVSCEERITYLMSNHGASKESACISAVCLQRCVQPPEMRKVGAARLKISVADSGVAPIGTVF